MKKAKSYIDQLESWEQDAYSGGYGEDWLIDVGEGVRHYAEQCWVKQICPTFKGLIDYLASIR